MPKGKYIRSSNAHGSQSNKKTANKWLITVCQVCHEELQSLMRHGNQEIYLKIAGIL